MEVSASSATQSLATLGRRVNRGVRSSLDAFVNDIAGRSSKTHDWQVMILLGESIDVYGRTKSGPQLLAQLGPELDEGTRSELERAIAKARQKRVSVRFSPERAVTRMISLPASAEDVIAAIVRNKVESLAPWPLSEALWGIRRQKDDPQTGQLSVEVGIIGRRALETLVRSLAKSGINVDHVDIGDSVNAGETIEVDFLRENKTDRIRKRLTATMAALGVVAVIGAGMGTYLALSSMAELEDVEARTDALTSRLRNESSDSGQGTKLADARSLAARKQSEQPAIQIIEALTTLIPDGTWLETLDYEDRKLTVVGRGTSLAPIVEALEKSPVFSEVNIAAATQRDAAANVDSFSISASVDPMSAPP